MNYIHILSENVGKWPKRAPTRPTYQRYCPPRASRLKNQPDLAGLHGGEFLRLMRPKQL